MKIMLYLIYFQTMVNIHQNQRPLLYLYVLIIIIYGQLILE